MNSSPPAVAVLIPVFGNQEGLDRSLASIASEDITFSVVVVDDGSPTQIRVPKRLPDGSTVTLLRLEENSGIEAALNAGVELILRTGIPYIARLDAGDLNEPGRLTKQLAAIEEEGGYELVGAAARFTDSDGRLLFVQRMVESPAEISWRMHINNVFCHPATMISARAIADVGGYPTDYPGAEDYELFFQLTKRYRVRGLSEPLVSTIADPSGISRSRRSMQLRSRLRIQTKHFDPFLLSSYVGLLATLLLIMAPSGLMDRVKTLSHRHGG